MNRNKTVIGVISDTHGLLRPEALHVLRNSAHIIHAGDIGDPEILSRLEEIAPVSAVRGNNDREAWARRIPVTQRFEIYGKKFFVIHDLHEMKIDPSAQGISIVISGHSHQPKIERHNGVLFLNPGSAGPRRFRLPITVALLYLKEEDIRARIIDISKARRLPNLDRRSRQ